MGDNPLCTNPLNDVLHLGAYDSLHVTFQGPFKCQGVKYLSNLQAVLICLINIDTPIILATLIK